MVDGLMVGDGWLMVDGPPAALQRPSNGRFWELGTFGWCLGSPAPDMTARVCFRHFKLQQLLSDGRCRCGAVICGEDRELFVRVLRSCVRAKRGEGTETRCAGRGTGCMSRTSAVGVVRADGGAAAVLTAATRIASFSAPRSRCRSGLKPVGMRGGRHRLVSLARRVAAPVCPRAVP